MTGSISFSEMTSAQRIDYGLLTLTGITLIAILAPDFGDKWYRVYGFGAIATLVGMLAAVFMVVA